MNKDKLKSLREEFELTQKDISLILGCSRSAYSLWEINKNTIPLYYLNKIANYFDINIDYLTDLSTYKKVDFKKKEINPVEIGKRIKEARMSINYTQEKIATKLNTTHSVISSYENGKVMVPTLFLIEIAKITNKSLNWLLNKI